MSDIPKWLEDLRRQPDDSPPGNLAMLRAIVDTGETQVIDGVKTPAHVAEVMLRVHDDLAPSEQEIFAAECNNDFRGCAERCLTLEALNSLSQLFVTSDDGNGDSDETANPFQKLMQGVAEAGGGLEITITITRVPEGEDRPARRKRRRRRKRRGDDHRE